MRQPTEYRANRAASPSLRMSMARSARLEVVRQLFGAAQVAFPPKQLLLRGFKRERLLEVWAASERTGPLTHVTTYGFCYASGTIGPKRRAGDGQVPEGFYTIGYFNSASAFHLSMQVSYPNLSDRILGDPVDPGSDIMIHGDCVSIGCISLSDERVEELWVIVTALHDWRGRVFVHLFPSRNIRALIASGVLPEHHSFWRNLLVVFDAFQRNRLIPTIRVSARGMYELP